MCEVYVYKPYIYILGSVEIQKENVKSFFFFFFKLCRPSGIAVSNKRSIKVVKDLCKTAFEPGKKLK